MRPLSFRVTWGTSFATWPYQIQSCAREKELRFFTGNDLGRPFCSVQGGQTVEIVLTRLVVNCLTGLGLYDSYAPMGKRARPPWLHRRGQKHVIVPKYARNCVKHVTYCIYIYICMYFIYKTYFAYRETTIGIAQQINPRATPRGVFILHTGYTRCR